jgi:fatty-acyl-CoA synthase
MERTDFDIVIKELVIVCREKLAHFKTPDYFKFVESFPMTVTGKVQKFVMRDMFIRELKDQGDKKGAIFYRPKN